MVGYNLFRDINAVGGLIIAPSILIALTVYILSKNPYGRLNNFFGGYAMSCAIYAFGLGMRAASLTPELALKWIKIMQMGLVLTGPFFLFFIFTFTKRQEWVENFFSYFLIFGFNIFLYVWRFILIPISVSEMYKGSLDRWSIPATFPERIIEFWIPALMIIGLFICGKFYRKTKDPSEKKQALFIMLAGGTPLVFGVFSQIILPEMKAPAIIIRIVLFIFALSPVVTAGSLAYAASKYKLFSFLTPSTAADTILETMKEVLIVVNQKGNVEFINRFTSSLLEYKKEELAGRSLYSVISQKKEDAEAFRKEVVSKIEKGEDVVDIETALLTESGKNIPVVISGSPLTGPQGKLKGMVIVAKDVSEIKELINTLEIKVKARTKELEQERAGLEEKVKERTRELERNMEELKKFKELAVGREMKMVELKEEVSKLKERLGEK